jgi:site-specific DNA recombinase
MNRLRMEHRASASHARLERATIDREIAQVIRAIREGFAGPQLKATMSALQARKAELDGQLAATQDPIPLLHPNMADVYRAKVEELRAALEREDSRAQAAEAIRALIDGIVLTPDGDGLNCAEGQPGGDARGRPKRKKVAGNGRPLMRSNVGCGGGI